LPKIAACRLVGRSFRLNDLPSGAIDQEELDKVLLRCGTSVDAVGAASVPEPSAGQRSLRTVLAGTASSAV